MKASGKESGSTYNFHYIAMSVKMAALCNVLENIGGADGARTRDLLRDRQAF
jgi:hypothetical protein